MITRATENLKNIENIRIIRSDLTELEFADIPIRFDITFSNAVLHWIYDHARVFKNFYDLLYTKGELLIQCGGFGNLQNTILIFDAVRESSEFKSYFSGWRKEWNFAKPLDTKNILEI